VADLSAATIGSLSKDAAVKRDQWLGMIREALEFAFPNRSALHGAKAGQELASANWDSTAPLAVQRYAERMMEFTPPGTDFIVLEPGPFAEMLVKSGDMPELKRELKNTAAMVNAALQAGSFFIAAHEMYLDHAVGIGGMVVSEADALDASAVARFVAQPLGTFYVEDGPDGRAHRRWRWFEMKISEISQMWPDATLPEVVQISLAGLSEAARERRTVKLIELEYFDWDKRDADEPWSYAVVVAWGHGWHDLVRRQRSTSQWLTPRHTKRAGESMGRGPLITAMPDIRTANKVTEMTFRAIALNLLGIYTVTEKGANTLAIRLRPATFIPVRSNGGPTGPSIARLDNGNFRPDFSAIILDRVVENIKRAHGDAALPPIEGPVRSATEIAARLRELALDDAGAYGRIMAEFIVPLVQILLDILRRRGWIRSKFAIDNLLVKVSVSSPVARAQRMADLERIIQWLEILKSLGGLQLMMIGAHLDRVPEKIAELLGVDMDLVQDEKQREQSQKSMAQVIGMQMGGPAAGDQPPGPQAPQELAAAA
jgi:hypothetical protein